MMREMIKKDWPYLLLIVFLILVCIAEVGGFKYGFITAYDEGYFLLKLQEAYDMSCITGKSQWNLIAVKWFPYLDLTSKINSYLAADIIKWITVLLTTVTACIIYDRRRVIQYLALIFFVYAAIRGGTVGLNYFTMQEGILAWALCAFLLMHHFDKLLPEVLYAVICGLNLGLSCFVQVPAGLLLLACCALAIVILYWGQWTKMITLLMSGIVGAGLSVVYVHLFVCDISDIIKAMKFTTSYISKSGYNYDVYSFLIQYGLFARDMLFVIIAIVGAYYISKVISNKYIGGFTYVVLIWSFFHYLIKPSTSAAMYIISLVVVPLLFGDKAGFSSGLKRTDLVLFLFLLLFPVIAPFGTNTYLGGRLLLFVVAWLFLFFKREHEHPNEEWGRVIIGVIVIISIGLIKDEITIESENRSHHFTRGNKYFAEIGLTARQAEYFDFVYDIMEEYNFKPKESVVFTSVLDYGSLYAFDAVNSSNFHQINNFIFFDKESMLKPDFIFLSPNDSIIIAAELREMSWGWPEEFDEFYVGSPEAPMMEGGTKNDLRKLYCRKSLKKDQNSILQ